MTAAQHSPRSRQAGQSSMEYVLLCAVVAFALGIGMGSDDSALQQLLKAFALAYQNLTFALALP